MNSAMQTSWECKVSLRLVHDVTRNRASPDVTVVLYEDEESFHVHTGVTPSPAAAHLPLGALNAT